MSRKKRKKSLEKFKTRLLFIIPRKKIKSLKSKASKRSFLQFFQQTMRLSVLSNRDSFFKIKRGADDAVQDHPKKTRFGRTCSRRKTADRNQTLPLPVSRARYELSRLFTSGDISILPIIRFSLARR